MSRKRAKSKQKSVEAIPDEILAEGSGPAEVAVVAQAVIERSEDQPTGADALADASQDALEEGAVVAIEIAFEAADAGAIETSIDASDEGAIDELAADPVSELAEDAPVLEASGEPADEAADEAIDDVAGATLPTSAASMDAVQLKHLVEALVFASDKPVTIQRLRQLTRVSEVRRLEQALAELTEDYKERGLIVQQVSGGYQFRTRTQFSAWVQQLIVGRPVRLSRAQLESLAIIAYRQPITRPEIDEIRGVDSSATLKLLMDRSLIRILGKREEVGRPILYGTTREFLDFFSLGDLRELPTLREYSELTDESRKVMSDRLGVGLEPAESNVIFDETAVDEPGEVAVELDDVELRPDETAGFEQESASAMGLSDADDGVKNEGHEVAGAHGGANELHAPIEHGESVAHGDATDDGNDVAGAHVGATDDGNEIAGAHVGATDDGNEVAVGATDHGSDVSATVDHDAHVGATELHAGDHDAHAALESEPPQGDADALATIASRVLAKADAAEAAELETDRASTAMAELAADEAPSDAAGDPAAE